MADDPFEYVTNLLTIKSRRGDRTEAICPAHDDRNASLSVSRGDDQPVVLHRCHAGCAPADVMAAIGLSLSDLSDLTPRRAKVYVYRDADGKELYSVERWVPKKFMPRLPDGTYARPIPADEVLYRLPEVIEGVRAGKPVYLVEGEKDADSLHEHGHVGTTAMSGAAQAWLPQFTDVLANATLIIVADNDSAGHGRARRVADEVKSYVRSVRVVISRIGKDITDHLLAGYSLDLLDPLPAQTALVIHGLGNVVATKVEWAWDRYIPSGMFTIIEGDPGDGKSVLSVDLCARWSTGMKLPDGSANPFGKPVPVAIMSAEDDMTRVIKPRVMVAGGNPDLVYCVEGVPAVGRNTRPVDLEVDLDLLRSTIEDLGLRVVFVDPLMAFMGNTSTAIDSEVRRVLNPLRSIAEETGCAVVAIRHLRKSGGRAIYAGGGSIAFTGAARTVFLVKRHPVKEDERILAIVKSNIAEMPTSLTYTVTADMATGGIPAPRVRWTGVSELTADDLLDPLFDPGSQEVRAEVARTIVEFLTIEDMDFEPLKRKVAQTGCECSEKTFRAVLELVATKVELQSGHVGLQGDLATQVAQLNTVGATSTGNAQPSSVWQ